MLSRLHALAAEADDAPAAAVLIGDRREQALARDAQTRQNLPTDGTPPAASPAFVNSLLGAPITGCTSILDRARIESGFDPLTSADPVALARYVEQILRHEALFVSRVNDVKAVQERDQDWTQLIERIVAFYPIADAGQRSSVRSNLLHLIGTVVNAPEAEASMKMLSQHTLLASDEIGVYVYITDVTFGKWKDGKETTEQIDFRVHRVELAFLLAAWDEPAARAIAAAHYKSLSDWLTGMNSAANGSVAATFCVPE